MNKHLPHDLAQMQSLPLESKIRMTQERIKIWYESWKRYTIYDSKTNKTRYVTWKEMPCKNGCYVKRTKTINGEKVEVDVLVKGTKLKDTEYIQSEIDGQVYVSFSGGKDSTVLKHIVDSMYNDVPAVFVNTGLEYPEIQKFVREVKAGKYDCFNSDIEILRPEMRFDEVIKKYGYPVVSKEISKKLSDANSAKRTGYKYSYAIRQFNGTYTSKNGKKSKYCFKKWKPMLDAPFNSSHMCCDVMKKEPVKKYSKQTGRVAIIGTMACESKLRYQNWIKNGCNSFNTKKPVSNPISFWTKYDVLHYIKKYNVPYCSAYGDIVIDEKVDGDAVLKGQMNLIDYLGCYEETDKLKTTGCNRTGCMFCMFGCHLEKEGEGRFEIMKQTHPKQYAYCMKSVEDGGLGLKDVIDWMNENCGTHIRY